MRWSEPEVGPQAHRLLAEQVRTVWAAMRATTLPARLRDPDGRIISAGRIGRAARDMATKTAIPLTRGGQERCALV